jgi:hypothetical protein
MLKFSVQTVYQPPFSKFPLAILFPSGILFPSKSFPHQKAQNKKPKPKLKVKAKGKSKKSLFLFQGSFTNSHKQGGAATLREGRDIVTGETCVPAFLNTNNSGETAQIALTS